MHMCVFTRTNNIVCICSRTCQSLERVLLIMGMLTSTLPCWRGNHPGPRVSLRGAAHKHVCADVLFISHIYGSWHVVLRFIARCLLRTLLLRVIPLMMGGKEAGRLCLKTTPWLQSHQEGGGTSGAAVGHLGVFACKWTVNHWGSSSGWWS